MAKRFKKKKTTQTGASLLAPTSRHLLPGSFLGRGFQSLWIPPLLAAVAFFAYWPSLKSDFVYDARVEILEEGFITSISNLPAVLSLKVLGMNLMLGDRPGQLLYLMLIAAVCGKEPFGYHLCSNFLHAANVAFLFLLLRRLIATEMARLTGSAFLKAQLAAVAATLIFALHPIAVEPVSGVNFSSDLLVTFFTLLGLLAATAFRPDNVRKALLMGGAGAFCAFAAVTCKESGMAAAPLLVVYWFLFRRGEAKAPWLCFLGAATALMAAFLAVRFLFAPPSQTHLEYLGGSFSHVFLMQPRLWVFMMGKLLWSAQLSADYTLGNLSGLSTPVAFVILIIVLGLQAWLAAKSRIGALGIAIYWLGLATVSNFMPLYRPLADRFYYLPLTGVALQLAALFLMTLRSRWGFWAALAPFLLAILPLTALNFARQAAFTNDFSLWSDTLKVSPHSALARCSLGVALYQKKQLTEAMAQFQKALEIYPNYVEAHSDLGIALVQKGRIDEAIAELHKALQINPDFGQAHNSLALALVHKGQIDAAITEFQKALQIYPNYAEAHNNLGNLLFKMGRLDEAIAELQKALQINPHYTEALNNLGNTLLQKGQSDEAIAEYQKALGTNPDYAEAHNNLGNALDQKGRIDEAMAQYQKALEINPNYAEAHNDLGNALAQQGREDEAIVEYKKALEINPDYVEAHNNLGIAFFQKGRLDEAIIQFKEVVRLNPSDTNAQTNLAKTQALVRHHAP